MQATQKAGMQRHAAIPCLVLALLLFIGAPGAAQASAETADREERPETEISIGLGVAYAPEFQGAEDNEVRPLPLITVKNLYRFNIEGMALSYDLLRTSRKEGRPWSLRVGPSLSPDFGRDEDDSDFLEGLGDIDTGFLAGGFANAAYGPVMLNLSGGQDVADGHGGAVIAARLGLMLPLGEALRLMPGISTTWASEDYMQSYFGISDGQAANSIYDPFTAEAGFKDIGFALNSQFEITETWVATGLFSYTRLIGDAADSPLVQGPGGSEHQFLGLIGLSYRFSL